MTYLMPAHIFSSAAAENASETIQKPVKMATINFTSVTLYTTRIDEQELVHIVVIVLAMAIKYARWDIE